MRRTSSSAELPASDGITLVFASRDDRFLLSEITDLFGNRIIIYRNVAGLITDVLDTCDRRIQFTYDVFKTYFRDVSILPAGERDRHSLVRYSYDADDNLIQVVDCRGASVDYFYDHHLLVSFTNRLGGIWNYQYDKDRKCIASWRGDGTLVRRMSRDDERRRVRVEDSYGVQTIIGFDQAYRPTDITDALGRIKEDVYDLAGNVLSTPATSPLTICLHDGLEYEHGATHPGRPGEDIQT